MPIHDFPEPADGYRCAQPILHSLILQILFILSARTCFGQD